MKQPTCKTCPFWWDIKSSPHLHYCGNPITHAQVHGEPLLTTSDFGCNNHPDNQKLKTKKQVKK